MSDRPADDPTPPPPGTLAPGEIAALVAAEHGDPFALLGPHALPSGGVVVRCLVPGARAVAVVGAGGDDREVAELAEVDPAGLFAGRVAGWQRPQPYRLRVTDGAGGVSVVEDAYRFPSPLGPLDRHLFAEGTHLRAWEKLGAHPVEIDGVAGTAFAVWAPNARRVAVVGDFNAWDGRRHGMRRHPDCGVWDIFVPEVGRGARYKFEIKGPDGARLPLKADPVALAAEAPPATASVVHGVPARAWSDDGWIAGRARRHRRDQPIAIYEVHPASWRRPGDGRRYLSWGELAEQLIPYVGDLGFTHIELMPIAEYPFDGSWGYQPTGLYAPSARFGSPEDLQAFVDACHQAELGVLVDWVPGHFPTDDHGLARCDGTHLYEHADPRQGRHRDWDTLIYNYGRREVSNFLMNAATYWHDTFHIDGVRIDAVASMLYLDYSRAPGDWVPNPYGGNENLDAIAFLRRLNARLYERFPGIMTIAEESTAWPAVSRPAYTGGLGFGYKWNMGWMHDVLVYFSHDPVHRRWHHERLTFGLVYAFSENFVLPLSHDEIVHGKASLLSKMPGDHWQKFANLRALYAFMWTHPGKKLLFMGGEFGQWTEWDHDRALDWPLLDVPRHRGLHRLVGDLNRLYRTLPALHARDCEPEGFAWVDCADNENSVIAYLRYGAPHDRPVLVVANLTPVPRAPYRVGVPIGGRWAERLNTDARHYEGSGLGNAGGADAAPTPWHGRPWSLALTLPPLAVVVFEAPAAADTAQAAA